MISKINIATIRRQATASSFERGQHYFEKGAVLRPVLRGQELTADVEGSEFKPYRVILSLGKTQIKQAFCSCPYNFEGWCKHIVATALMIAREPDAIEQRPELTEQLVTLQRDQLQTILENLGAQRTDWIDAIEMEIMCLTAPKIHPGKKVLRQTAVDPTPIERQVEWIIRQYEGQWDDYGAIDEIRTLIAKATPYLAQGDGNNALTILGAITRAYSRDWMNLDGSSGESGELFSDLDDAITEAILSADLSERDRQQWEEELRSWRSEADNYGIDSFAMSLTALTQGWDYPPLVQVVAGNITELGAWEDEAPDFADDLALIRLRILARQNRNEDYLHFAEAEGQTQAYLQMLVRLGRNEEAVAQAQTQITTPEEALEVAKSLVEQENFEEAIQVAHEGLKFEGTYFYQLAVWLSELSEEIGDRNQALETRIDAFKDSPSLEDYQKIQSLAGTRWNQRRATLLQFLQSDAVPYHEADKISIFLEEGMMDEAIQVAETLGAYQSRVILSVMDAAIGHRPDWVIRQGSLQTEAILDQGQAKKYSLAIQWLRHVKAAYLKLDQPDKWQDYRAELTDRHGRKRKFLHLLGDIN